MYVADIIDEASEITGLAKGPSLYKKISQAIKLLSRKGNWDSLLLYLDINVQDGNIVTLPREVETPLRVNINKHPAFSRGKLFEFSLNGPGSDDRQFVNWQWADRVATPIMADLPADGVKLTVISEAGDDLKVIRFYGLDKDGQEISDTLNLSHADPPTTANSYAVMRRVRKDMTVAVVRVIDDKSNAIASYYSNELQPSYRQIKLTKSAASIHMFFRRSTSDVTSDNDYIPLESDLAILMALRAIAKYKNAEGASLTEAASLEEAAVKYLKEEQDARNSFMSVGQGDSDPSALNLNINNRDSVIVADIIDDASAIFGPIGREKLYDRVTEAVELLQRKYPAWLGTDGYIDLTVSGGGYVTLPRYIESPIAINYGDRHLQARNRWFEFHLNGPSPCCQSSCRHWDDIGDVVTVDDPAWPFRLVAINDLEEDNDSKITVYGHYPNGSVIRSAVDDVEDEERKWQDGIVLTSSQANSLPSPDFPLLGRITRITRDKTQGYQTLLAYNCDMNESALIGYFYPDETEPKYKRIKLPRSAATWVRMRYRKRWLKVSELTDQLHLRSRTAIVEAMTAIKFYRDKDPVKGKAFEELAVSHLREEENSANPPETFEFQFDTNTDMADPMQGQY